MSLCFCVAWLINLCKIWARIELIRCTRSIVALTHTTHRVSDCALFNFRWFVACMCVCVSVCICTARTLFLLLSSNGYICCVLCMWLGAMLCILDGRLSLFRSSNSYEVLGHFVSFLKNKTSTPVVSKNIISHKFAIKKKMRDTASKIALKNAYTTHIHLGYELIF